MISTYPPTQCGLATFSQSLFTALIKQRVSLDVIRVVDTPEPSSPPEVAWQLVNGRNPVGTARALNRYDLLLLQHEYGIFGGQDGETLLDVLAHVSVPVVTVLHTVLADPTPHQREVLQTVVGSSATLVTMTHTARNRLIASYAVDPDDVVVIPHGAADDLLATRRTVSHGWSRPTVLTWGLLGPGKGIEWGIEAMAMLRDLDRRPRYVVAGQTHPRVLERDGEQYRKMLMAKADALGVADDVVFEDGYLSARRLHRLIEAADVVLLPYDSTEQVTSGVLIEAVAAGRPVVSTRFPHAVELLSDGAGVLVERADPRAIADALRQVLGNPATGRQMSARAGALAQGLSWTSVAGRYAEVGRAQLARPVTVSAEQRAGAMATMAVA